MKLEHVQWESKGAGPLGGVEGRRPSWGCGGNATTRLKCKKKARIEKRTHA